MMLEMEGQMKIWSREWHSIQCSWITSGKRKIHFRLAEMDYIVHISYANYYEEEKMIRKQKLWEHDNAQNIRISANQSILKKES